MKKEITPITVDQHITLKIKKLSEAPELFALVDKNRSHLGRWLPWVDETKTAQDTESYIKGSLEGLELDIKCDFGFYFDDILVGCGGFNKIDMKNKSGEIGYWISRDRQGKGIVSKSVEAIIEFGKSEFGLNRIVIKVDARNDRSSRIPESLGFQREESKQRENTEGKKYIVIETWSKSV